jgi:hypothetical protein
MEGLSLDNILTDSEVEDLFGEENIQEETPEEKKTEEENKDKEETTEIDAETLFDNAESESVGSGKVNKDGENTNPEQGSTSPNFYSSIAKALTEEGIFPDLDDDTLSKVVTPEDFKDLVEQQIQAGLDERYKRIDEALNGGMEPTEVRKYETLIDYLNSIGDAQLNDESEEGEKLRKNIIYQDYINRGYSKERATREVQKSITGGTDIDDAKEALTANLEFYQAQYNGLLQQAQQQIAAEQQERKQKAEALKNSILTDKKVFGEVEVDKNTRQRILDNIMKPVYKDPDTGEVFTAIQKYERENSNDFLKYVGFLFTMTDGFKNLDALVKGKVSKEVKKGMRELENVLNGNSRVTGGNLRFANGANDPESFFADYSIDI